MERPIHRVLDLVDDSTQELEGMSLDGARDLLADHPERVGEIGGSFALTARNAERVLMARSLDRPLRFFLAKEREGPFLVVAERIDEIQACLEGEGHGEQFHPTYTRMVPAHHVTELRLIGCPDPNPRQIRFFEPRQRHLAGDLDTIGERYVAALLDELRRWVERQDDRQPIGVLFSGGIDSGAVLCCLHRALLDLGQTAQRLKAFTLSAGGGGEDLEQARAFLERVGLSYLHEVIAVPADAVDPLAAIEVIEDYKPLDVECAAVALALLAGIRQRYPDWKLVVDGDGGDENLKDYPLEEGGELTIRSVVSNPMLYQEGWGVDAVKHSLTYSGGYSRGCVRTFAPLRRHGFVGFSPFTRPELVAIAEGIPFDELTEGSVERLYSLKGEVVRRGMEAVLGVDFPVFEKRRFQVGATDPALYLDRFATDGEAYRRHFLGRFA